MHEKALLIASAVLLGSACSAPYVAVEPRYGVLELDGDLAVSSGGSSASNSLDSLGLEDDEGSFGARVDARWLMPHLTVWGSQSEHDGDGTLEADLSEGGTTITAGTDVDSELDLAMLNGVVTFDLFPGETFEAGIGLGLALLDVEAAIEDRGTGDRVETDEVFPLPLLALRVGGTLGFVELEGLLSGMALDFDDNDATYHDLDLTARVRVLGEGDHATGYFVLGYRDVGLEVDYEDGSDSVDADLSLSGPYIGLRFRF